MSIKEKNDKITKEILELKKRRNAVILVHNYQLPEVQDIADFTGDSLGLSMQAAKTSADTIVFCGVRFMAETAKILSPAKTVLLADPKAGCPMADMITAEQLREEKKKHPSAKILCYVNTSAEVKAEADVCCTSANAVEVAARMFDRDDEIIFVPDKYLASYVARKTGLRIIPWHGYCPTHVKILKNDIEKIRKRYPGIKVLVHSECNVEVQEAADEVLSTEGMCRFVSNDPGKRYALGTEPGMLHRLRKEYPEKEFYPLSEMAICPNMKKTTLEKVLFSLKEMQTEVFVADHVAQKALESVRRMFV